MINDDAAQPLPITDTDLSPSSAPASPSVSELPARDHRAPLDEAAEEAVAKNMLAEELAPAKPEGPTEDASAKAKQSAELLLWLPFVGTALTVLAQLRAAEGSVHDVWERLDQLKATVTRPSPVSSPEAVPKAFVSDWGVSARPARITWDFCNRLKWQTPRDKQKALVPSASSRSQYLRVATNIPEIWGRLLDQRHTSYENLRWIAVPDEFVERQDRSERVLAGEHPAELLKRPAPRRGARSKGATGVAVQKAPRNLCEEDLVRVEAYLESIGQTVHLPRRVPAATQTEETAEGAAPAAPTTRKRKPR